MSFSEVKVSKEKEANGKPLGQVSVTMLGEVEKASDAVESTTSDSLVTTTVTRWRDLGWRDRVYVLLIQGVGKPVALVLLLYLFVCSLDLLSSSFRLLGGRAAGAAFSNSALLENPMVGLMIGVLGTVLLQSSSTSTSITVTMVASGILSVRTAIPIIMGANIGTSVTSTIASLAQSSNRNEFRRAFSGATVHDMFNWLTVFILLPTEILTGYLYHLTSAVVNGANLNSTESLAAANKATNRDLLKVITQPITDIIVQLDKRVIEGIAVNDSECFEQRLLKIWCSYEEIERGGNQTVQYDVTHHQHNLTSDWLRDRATNLNTTNLSNPTSMIPIAKCSALFSLIDVGDVPSGVLLLLCSLALLCSCLVLLVKLLKSSLSGSAIRLVRKVVNAGSDSEWSGYLVGYLAMLVGGVLTMIIQSSSVFTSALTPLVGVGVVKLERMYPLTLGSNLGTTTTGLLAAMAADGARLRPALQIALVHLFFNLTGIIIFYPLPCLRLPIRLARIMGDTTARYRWFALFYVIIMFFFLPLLIFSLSLIHPTLMLSVFLPSLAIFIFIIIINQLQKRKPSLLPKQLRDWSFLPLALRSLDPLDGRITRFVTFLQCCSCVRHIAPHEEDKDEEKSAELIVINSAKSLGSSIHVYYDDDDDDDTDDATNRKVLPYKDCDNDKVLPSGQCESGYVSRNMSQMNTPENSPSSSPCISRLPSLRSDTLPKN